jgi:hypothetical protein
MGRAKIFILILLLALVGGAVSADDLTGASRLLCAAVQATACVEDGECGIDLPWNLNIPDFIEVDLEAKRLSTTAASGENRATAIEHLTRQDGLIVFHGLELGRAFSWVISEETGRATVAVATDGASVAVFGACTPMLEAAGPAGR